jgi:hypothetical protein
MKDQMSSISKIRVLLGLMIIAALCNALPVRAGLPYTNASTVSQLNADINYANTAGGTFTINLQPNTTFTNGQQVIGGAKTVNLTIIGNGDTIDGNHVSRLFGVASGSSLTLNQLTLQNGYIYADDGGAIYNEGTLTISGCNFTNNTSWYSGYISSLLGGDGGAIYNGIGTVVINNSTLDGNIATGSRQAFGGAIYNESGTVRISNTTLNGNSAGGFGSDDFFAEGGAIYNGSGKVTLSKVTMSGNIAEVFGGGIFNAGGMTIVANRSSITGNTASGASGDVQNSGVLYLDNTSTIGILNGNPAISEPSPRISRTTSNTIVISWLYPSAGWSVQQNSDLATTNWVTPTNTIANDGTNNFIIAAPTLNKLFFRLKN